MGNLSFFDLAIIAAAGFIGFVILFVCSVRYNDAKEAQHQKTIDEFAALIYENEMRRIREQETKPTEQEKDFF